MQPKIDLTGKRFGKLTAIRVAGKTISHSRLWLCQCDCGNTTKVIAAKLNNGHTRSCGCWKKLKGPDSPKWKGGRYIDKRTGYVYVIVHGHPNAGLNGRVLEHTYIMSQHLGRPLGKGETVHHKNGVRDDNRAENLELRAGNHGPGQSIEDLVMWAHEVLDRYEPKLQECNLGWCS